MKTRLATFAASLAALSASAAPTVSNVQMTQPDFAATVTITYDLSEMEDKNWNETWEQQGYEPIVIGNECII